MRKASAIHPIHTVEMEYSLDNRSIETEMIGVSKEFGTEVLAFRVLSRGLISETSLESPKTSQFISSEDHAANLEFVRALKLIADEKGISVSDLALLWTFAKYDHVSALVGTTNKDHLIKSIDALKTELTAEDIERIEAVFPAEKVKGIDVFIAQKFFQIINLLSALNEHFRNRAGKEDLSDAGLGLGHFQDKDGRAAGEY